MTARNFVVRRDRGGVDPVAFLGQQLGQAGPTLGADLEGLASNQQAGLDQLVDCFGNGGGILAERGGQIRLADTTFSRTACRTVNSLIDSTLGCLCPRAAPRSAW